MTKVEQIILYLSLDQQKYSLSIMYLLAWNIFALQASLWTLYVIPAVQYKQTSEDSPLAAAA